MTDHAAVGDEVLYRQPSTGTRTPALVLEVARHDGDLMLDTGEGRALAALDVKHGPGRHQWLTYEEAARLTPTTPNQEQ